jgi:hypothetical protein
MNESEQFEFSLRYEKLINETATEQEISAMEQEIINDPEALKLYQDLSLQHGHLSTSRARDAVETASSYHHNHSIHCGSSCNHSRYDSFQSS